MCLAERSFNFFSPTVVFFLTWESVERRITSLKSFFRKKRKGELVDNETMHRKVRVNVATFGRFADSVNHQQHRRSWAHAVLTDARFLSFSSFFYSFSYYSLSLFILYYILRTPLCTKVLFHTRTQIFCSSVTDIIHKIIIVSTYLLVFFQVINHLTMDIYIYVHVLLCSNCAFICNIICDVYDRDMVSVDPV